MMWLSWWCWGTKHWQGWWTHIQEYSHMSTRPDCSYCVWTLSELVVRHRWHTRKGAVINPKCWFQVTGYIVFDLFIMCSNWNAIVTTWKEKPGQNTLKWARATIIFLYSEEILWVLLLSVLLIKWVCSSEGEKFIQRFWEWKRLEC